MATVLEREGVTTPWEHEKNEDSEVRETSREYSCASPPMEIIMCHASWMLEIQSMWCTIDIAIWNIYLFIRDGKTGSTRRVGSPNPPKITGLVNIFSPPKIFGPPNLRALAGRGGLASRA